jgi:tRNA A-37 threonylcarbamoyl transferase component Bud32
VGHADPHGWSIGDLKCDLYMQMLTGLAYLHEHNICHCDIKPSNIMVRFAVANSSSIYSLRR